MRIVSLTCSNTEIVCALGAADQLVGVDDHSDFPADVVGALPRVGPDLSVDPEAVVALQPDLVLASLTVPGHEKVVDAIAATGLSYLAPRPQSVRDVARDIRDIAAALGVSERGERVAREFLLELERLEEDVRDAAYGEQPPSLLVQWWPKPVIAPGRRSWVHDLLGLVGATHPLQDEDVESRPLEESEVVGMAPDAFVLSWCGVEAHKVRPDRITGNPTYEGLRAAREDRVFCVPEAWLGRPSPRLLHGARALRRIVETVQGEQVLARDDSLRDPSYWRSRGVV